MFVKTKVLIFHYKGVCPNNSVCQNNSVWIILALNPIYGQQPQTEDLKPVVAPRIRDATGNPRNPLSKVPGRFSPPQSPEKDLDKKKILEVFKRLQAGVRGVQIDW